MITNSRRLHISRKALRDHWAEKGYEYLFRRFSWKVADNIFDSDSKSDVCWCCGVLAKTQLAHITPKSQGGECDMSNLFLLCTKCHRDSPDTTYPEFFDMFVSQEPQAVERAVASIVEVSKRYDISGLDIDRTVLDVVARAKECSGTHDGSYSDATIKAIVDSVLRECCRPLRADAIDKNGLFLETR